MGGQSHNSASEFGVQVGQDELRFSTAHHESVAVLLQPLVLSCVAIPVPESGMCFLHDMLRCFCHLLCKKYMNAEAANLKDL